MKKDNLEFVTLDYKHDPKNKECKCYDCFAVYEKNLVASQVKKLNREREQDILIENVWNAFKELCININLLDRLNAEEKDRMYGILWSSKTIKDLKTEDAKFLNELFDRHKEMWYGGED